MRLALKAQSQCRATVETLATIKNPPVVYAKQANFANGHQQVNNSRGFADAPTGAPPAHGKTEIEPTKLLDGEQHGSTDLDAGTAATPARSDSTLETVAEVNRSDEQTR